MRTEFTVLQCYLDHIAIHLNCDPVKQMQRESEDEKAHRCTDRCHRRHVRGTSPNDPDPTARLRRRGRCHGGPQNSSVGGLTDSDSDGYKATGKIFGGYEFDQNWAAEVGYTDFRSRLQLQQCRPNAQRTKGDGYYMAGKYNYPVNDQFSVYGKLGVRAQRAQTEQRRAER